MIELGLHIQSILLCNDCVSVPGLGGFVTRHVSACPVPGEELFLPPYRAVAFNAGLSANDGMLVQSYMTAYDLNYPDALRKVEAHVAELRDILQTEGSYELEGIGTLKMNFGGGCDFVPNEAGVVSPLFYGLDAIRAVERYAPVEQSIVDTPAPISAEKKSEKEAVGKRYTFSINKKLVDVSIAAMRTGVMYFLVSSPLGDMRISGAREASFAPQMPVAATPFVAAANKTAIPTISAPTPKAEAHAAPTYKATTQVAPQEPVLQASVTTYSVVMASAISAANAENFVNHLHGKGYAGAYVYRKGKMTRVLYKNYSTEAEAEKAARYFRSETEWKEVWVIKLDK